MRSRNAVRALGGGLLTSIHEYRISCNRSPRLVLEQSRATRGLHSSKYGMHAAGGARPVMAVRVEFCCWESNVGRVGVSVLRMSDKPRLGG